MMTDEEWCRNNRADETENTVMLILYIILFATMMFALTYGVITGN